MLLQTTILFQPTKLRKIFDICKSLMQIFAKMGEKNEEFNGKGEEQSKVESQKHYNGFIRSTNYIKM